MKYSVSQHSIHLDVNITWRWTLHLNKLCCLCYPCSFLMVFPSSLFIHISCLMIFIRLYFLCLMEKQKSLIVRFKINLSSMGSVLSFINVKHLYTKEQLEKRNMFNTYYIFTEYDNSRTNTTELLPVLLLMLFM